MDLENFETADGDTSNARAGKETSQIIDKHWIKNKNPIYYSSRTKLNNERPDP